MSNITFNPKSLKTPEQIKAYGRYKDSEKNIQDLAKKLQGMDDKVDVDLNSTRGEVVVDRLKVEKDINSYTGYHKYDPATGKTEELNIKGKYWQQDSMYAYGGNSEYIYTTEGDKTTISHSFNAEVGMAWGHQLIERKTKSDTFVVNNKTGDIECHIS